MQFLCVLFRANVLFSHRSLTYGFGCADAVSKVDEDSENLHYKFLAGEIELVEFIQKYRQHRLLYHRRSLIRLAALSSSTTPG